jgi:hypothetical protein
MQRPAKKSCRKRVLVEISPASSSSSEIEGEGSKHGDGMCTKDMKKMTEEGPENL